MQFMTAMIGMSLILLARHALIERSTRGGVLNVASLRSLLIVALTAFAFMGHVQYLTAAETEESTALAVEPGTVVRWSAPGTTECGMTDHTWSALEETCYYPVDLLHKPGRIKITRVGHDKSTESAYIDVQSYSYATQEIDLGDIPQANPSATDYKRITQERKLLGKILKQTKDPALFTLPLGPAATPMPEGRDFGVERTFNGKPAGQPHVGADYAVPEGAEIVSVADGTVVGAHDMFFAGNAVFINHGDNLITMYFHLSEMNVTDGQKVKKGDVLGLVGSTGRSTGPHLFLGIRWHDARINPKFLFEDPAKIPSVNPSVSARSTTDGKDSGK